MILNLMANQVEAFLSTLKSRNTVLYYFGGLCFAGFMICAFLTLVTTRQVMGINAFIKPMKFYLSTGIFCWSMAWYMHLLDRQRAVFVYSWMVVVVMLFELPVVTGQAALGKLSHFNITSVFDAVLFQLMGLAIGIFTIWTAVINYFFFAQRRFKAPMSYVWGIRLGLLLFVLFAFEGYIMGAKLAHTVGAADGGPGLPITNWSREHGDLRIAHFLGMHTLQLLPLFGYYIARKPGQVIAAASIYFVLVTAVLVQALSGKPLLLGLGH